MPEIVGLIFAVAGAHLAFTAGADVLLASFLTSWGENIGFYSVVIYRETKHIAETRPDTTREGRLWIVTRNLTVEFGLAECVDSFFLRPACMFLCFKIFLDYTTATLCGKLMADIGFYAIAVSGYEFAKRYLK